MKLLIRDIQIRSCILSARTKMTCVSKTILKYQHFSVYTLLPQEFGIYLKNLPLPVEGCNGGGKGEGREEREKI